MAAVSWVPEYLSFNVTGSGPSIMAAKLNAIDLAEEAVPEGMSLVEIKALEPQVLDSITNYLDGVAQGNFILAWAIELRATCQRDEGTPTVFRNPLH